MLRDPANLLRERGVQVTARCLAVLRAVSRRPHCTADDVAKDVRAEIDAISRQAAKQPFELRPTNFDQT